MTTADRLREQGREQGRELGNAEGVARTITRLLTLKFGALSTDVQARIQTATPEQLERWTDRVLVANSPEDVLAG
jgi:hypothetical protein